MAASSTIRITFNEDLGIGNYVEFSGEVNSGGALNALFLLQEFWAVARVNAFQVAVGPPTGIPGERSAINFAQAVTLDSALNLTATRTGNVVTITGPILFIFGASDSNVTFQIINNSAVLFMVTNVNFSQAANPCSDIRVNVTTSAQASEILSPIQAAVTTNPFHFDWPRGQSIDLQVRNAGTGQASRFVQLPGLLNGDINLQINNTPFGATVVVNVPFDSQLSVQYSLDGINFQDSNVFSGQAPGNYTVYIRDQYGCSNSRTFHIDELGINTPYFHISKSNSLRFAQRIEWGDSGNYKTDENTLSHEVDAKMPYCEVQQFQSSDVIRAQFKSNYGERIAKVINEDDTEVVLPIEQMTSNIGLTDRRDARRFDLGNGKTGVYFTNGNTYDFITGNATGTYTLNGVLPEWALEGNFFGIFDGTTLSWFPIQQVYFDEVRNADVIVINQIYTATDSVIDVRSQYNRFNYEVYEFEIDMINFLGQTIEVSLENNDLNFTDLKHLSEKIDIKVRQQDTCEIRYWNSTNTDIVYATGIRNLLRIPFTKQEGKFDEENEMYKTDTSAKLLKSELYEVDEFAFEPVTKEIWRKICQALSHDTVFIDGVGYSKNSEFSTEGPLEDSNLYVIKATMIKNGNVFSSLGNEDGGYGQSSLEIPGLIETGSNGFLRY